MPIGRSSRAAGFLAVLVLAPGGAVGQTPVPVRNSTDLFVLDLAGTPVGEIPTAIKQLKGTLEVVLKDGVPMLKASTASEFLITLPQVLPPDFTLEVDLVPKACCNPQDLSFEGTPAINQGPASAHILWDTDALQIIGGGESYDTPMPEEFRATLPGVLTTVVFVFEGPTVRLYTNGRRLYTLERRFVRGRVLRVFLGGQDDGPHAVHLARLRLAAGTGGTGIVAAQAGLPTPAGPTAGTQRTPPAAPTASQSQAAGGGSGRVVSVSVTPGTTGPLVTWTRLGGATSYTVRRWKIDDRTCCNATSPALPEAPWQDGPLPAAGTYVFEVTASTPAGIATGQAQFVQFATRKGIATVAPADSGAAGTVLAPRSPGATTSPTTSGNPAGAAAATLFAPPAPRTITLSAISAAGLPRPSAPAARTISLAAITATGGPGSGASPPPRTIALGELIATGPMIAVKAPTGAIAGLPGTNEGSAAPVSRTIPLAGITGSGGGGVARVPAARSIVLGGLSAAGNGERTISIPPRTITLPAVAATGSGKTP